MAGFRNIKQYTEAMDDGKTSITQFRKAVGSAATITSSYIDYSYFAGPPPATICVKMFGETLPETPS